MRQKIQKLPIGTKIWLDTGIESEIIDMWPAHCSVSPQQLDKYQHYDHADAQERAIIREICEPHDRDRYVFYNDHKSHRDGSQQRFSIWQEHTLWRHIERWVYNSHIRGGAHGLNDAVELAAKAKEERQMPRKHLEGVENGRLAVVGLKYGNNTKTYYFATVYAHSIGDTVLTEGSNTLMTVVETRVDPATLALPVTAMVVGYLYDQDYKEYIERQAKRQSIMDKMEQRYCSTARLDRYRAAAKDDPEMQRLLEELGSL